jgi:hypothetical protein
LSDGGESGLYDHHGHHDRHGRHAHHARRVEDDRHRSARKQKEEFLPTVESCQSFVTVEGILERTHLDLQFLITADAAVVHLVVGIIGIAAALVLDKGEAAQISDCWQGWMAREGLTVCWKRFGGRECRSVQGVRNY